MSDYYNDAIYGYTSGGTLGADMMNPSAQGSTDWGAVLSSGIIGAAQGAIRARVNGAYESGQLQQAAVIQQRNNQQLLLFVVIGAALYFATKG